MRRKLFAGMVVTMALLVAGAGALPGQEAPEPPAPPEPPEAPEVFVLNDGANLGVTLGDVSAEKAQELKLPAVAGALVENVQKDSPAAKAGLERGDVIVEFDGVRVRSSAELRRLIRETPPGRTVELKVIRDGKLRVLSAKLEGSTGAINLNMNMNMPEIHLPPLNFPPDTHRAALGIDGDDLTPQLAQYFGVKQGKGVLVSEVTLGGAADKAGLKAGDVIVQVDGKAVGSVVELRSALNDNFTDDTRKVKLTIVRDHHEQTVNADLTRSHARERRTSSVAGASYGQSLAQLQAKADQMRALADQERARVQSEVSKQQQDLRTEWQRQLREQMLALRDQFKQMQDFRAALRPGGEI